MCSRDSGGYWAGGPFKVYIAFNFSLYPYAGGTRFLDSIKSYFERVNVYTSDPSDADVILFNSHHNIGEIISLKERFPCKVFVHRIDGPVSVYNANHRKKDKRDIVVRKLNHHIADASIFQSEWSKEKNHSFGLACKERETVIHNAPDPDRFNMNNRIQFSTDRPVRLIAINWSPNPNKGLQTYEWLDSNLDWNRYQMSFIGHSWMRFKNIRHMDFLNADGVAEQLKKHDILIFPSRFEACSNVLLEGLHCGLPAVAYAGSSSPEILSKGGGELFTEDSQVPKLLEKIVAEYPRYQSHIKVENMEQVAGKYCAFFESLLREIDTSKKDRNLTFIQTVVLKSAYYREKLNVLWAY